MPPADYTPSSHFSFSVLLTLIVVVIASVAVFYWQVQRWTSDPTARALLDWARATGFALSRQPRVAPAPFDMFAAARATTSLEKAKTKVMQLEIPAAGGTQTPRWHLLVRELEASWQPTALRPAQAATSAIDLFSLTSFPRLGEVERFVVFGVSSASARLLSKSEARALLPADVGLLLHGQYLVLDFSARPFDPIEAGRMTALAEQLVTHLPLQR